MSRRWILGAIAAGAVSIAVVKGGHSTAEVDIASLANMDCLKDIQEGEICFEQNLDEKKQVQLMANRTLDPQGYFRLRSEGVDVVRSAKRAMKKDAKNDRDVAVSAEAKRCTSGIAHTLGFIREFPGRWTSVNVLPDKTEFVLIRDDVWAAGGKLGAYAFLHRFRVKGAPASIVLSYPSDTGAAVWLLSWAKGGVSFSVNVPDNLVSGKPERPDVEGLLKLAEAIDDRCHWQREKFAGIGIPLNPDGSLPDRIPAASMPDSH
ncbi:hypothetical protein C0Q88_00725 [Ralstonia pickettii]|uniref:Uncharacterized protein n=1 Tax=Ralstonia pickettii TaxID=329 RepID=A0A2N4TUC3_RALPI|nr:hypothetical protein C0Q88_23825 [Ralstonia pickettii]PLC43296.1 hypothetical protein C0Q88_00725 [Ralstonia pickettii]